jgi:hypothetical protein
MGRGGHPKDEEGAGCPFIDQELRSALYYCTPSSSSCCPFLKFFIRAGLQWGQSVKIVTTALLMLLLFAAAQQQQQQQQQIVFEWGTLFFERCVPMVS